MKRPRPAEPGDICILLLPSLEEISLLRTKQEELIKKYGGKAHETVHLTAQRFEMEKEIVPDFVHALHQSFDSFSAFPIYAEGLIQVFHQYWQTCLIRWQIFQSAKLIEFGEILESLIYLNKSIPHYQSAVGWQPTQVTALDNTRKTPGGRHLESYQDPAYLFSCKRIVVSEILGLNQFNIMDEFELGESND